MNIKRTRGPRPGMSQDAVDFLEMVEEREPSLKTFVANRLRDGDHPRDIAAALFTEALNMSGWCNGRFGA